MKLGNLKSFADSKRVKYGTINIILIAVCIAIVIMINSIVTVLSDALGWYLDMTEEQLYTVSEPLVELLEEVSEDVEIDIIFCCDKDEAEKSYSDLESGNSLAYVHSTATQIADKLDNVSLIYKDPVKDYEFMRRFTSVSSQIKPSESTVIIARRDANGNYGTFYRTYHASSFYTFSENAGGTPQIYGYSGERIFATAVLSLTQDVVPTVYFVMGHSEEVPYSSKGSYNIPSIAKVYMDCGFMVRYINLSDKQFTCKTAGCGESWGYEEVNKLEKISCDECKKEYKVKDIEFNEEREIPDNARALIINNPLTDYTPDETSKISSYLIDGKGTVMCFTDPSKGGNEGRLQNLYDLIYQETGVTVLDTDTVTDSNSSTIGGALDFRGQVASNTAASTYLSALQNFGSARPIFNNSGKLEIDERYMKEENGDLGYNDRAALRYTLPLIETAPSALYNDKAGRHTVMSVTSFTTMQNNEKAYSYFVVCPSADFLDDNYLSSAIYPNEGILMALIHSTTAVNVPVNLDFKTFANYQLDITSAQATTVFVCLVTILPLILAAAGVFVIVRRKHR